jgi:hypothetical protein
VSEKASWFDRVRFGPLLVLPVSARHEILQKIQRGEVVTNPERRALAQEWAMRSAKRSTRLALVALIVFIVSVLTALVQFSSHSYGPATTALAMVLVGASQAFPWKQARRFLQRNPTTDVVGKRQRTES